MDSRVSDADVIDPDSPYAVLCVAMWTIAQTDAGRKVVDSLRQTAMASSMFGANGQMFGPRRTAFYEGQRNLANKLLGTVDDALRIGDKKEEAKEEVE